MKILDLLKRGGKYSDGALAADIVEEPLVARFLPRDTEARAFALMVNRPLIFRSKDEYERVRREAIKDIRQALYGEIIERLEAIQVEALHAVKEVLLGELILELNGEVAPERAACPNCGFEFEKERRNPYCSRCADVFRRWGKVRHPNNLEGEGNDNSSGG